MQKSVIASACAALSTYAHASPAQPIWSFEAGAATGAAIVAQLDGRDLLRLSCRRSPAELFVIVPAGNADRERATLRLNDREIHLKAEEPNGAFAVELAPEHVTQLKLIAEIRFQASGQDLVLTGPEPDLSLSLAGACNLALQASGEAPADPGLQWFFALQGDAAHLGYGAPASEFFGPGFRCQAGAGNIDVTLSVPEDHPDEITLRSGDAQMSIPAKAEPDILNGGKLLTGSLPADHPLWEEFGAIRRIEVLYAGERSEAFEATNTSAEIGNFLQACSGKPEGSGG